MYLNNNTIVEFHTETRLHLLKSKPNVSLQMQSCNAIQCQISV